MMRPKIVSIVKLGFLVATTILITLTILGVQEQSLKNFPANSAQNRRGGIDYDQVHDPLQDLNITALEDGKWRNLVKNQTDALSKLGRILYLDEERPKIDPTRNYKILMWKYGSAIDDRHVKRYTNKSQDPFEFCSAKNCKLTYKDDDLDDADIVLIHMHRTKGVADLPPQKKRKKEQIWAFLTDESPFHTFMGQPHNISAYNGIFNWSMTYRMSSDIPVPYGRTILRKTPNADKKINVYSWLLTKKHDIPVAIMGSNCGSKNHRWEYVRELSKHIKVDTYGACGTLKCPGHFRQDCPEIGRYMFYLSFENSNCDEYITEKLWWNAYSKNSIPIVMGGPKSFYNSLLPLNSYINVDDFASPRDLATYLKYLINTPSELQRFFTWHKYFKVLNEHGYFQSISQHYCRVCEALNYNSRKTKVYKDMEKFLSVKHCYPAWDT